MKAQNGTRLRPDCNVAPSRLHEAEPVRIELTLTSGQLDVIAERVAKIMAERAPAPPDRWLSTQEADEYIGAKQGRVADLKQLGYLKPAGYDGRLPKYRRSDLDAYLRGSK